MNNKMEFRMTGIITLAAIIAVVVFAWLQSGS